MDVQIFHERFVFADQIEQVAGRAAVGVGTRDPLDLCKIAEVFRSLEGKPDEGFIGKNSEWGPVLAPGFAFPEKIKGLQHALSR